MNILLINHYAGSTEYGMEYRPYYLAREWVKMGHNVTIVGADFSHLRIKQPQAGEEIIDGIRYVWLHTPAYQCNGIGRIKNMLSFLWKLYRQEKWITGENKPDVVIASSTYPLDIYPAHYIAKKNKAKLVFEVHDIWPLTPMEIGHMSKYHPFIMVMQMAENYMCRHVDKLISILPKAEEHYREHGLAQGKFIHIPNGVVINKNSHEGKLPEAFIELFTKLRSKKKFILGYVGGMAKSNALAAFLEAATRVRYLPIDIVLIGDGAEKNNLQGLAQKYGLQQVHFLPAVSKSLVPKLLQQMNGLYIGWQDSRLYQYGVSANKIFDYLLAEKPILWAGNTGNNPVQEANAGITAVSSQPEDIANAIRQMAATQESQLAQWGANGVAYVKANHDYEKLAANFVVALDK